MKDNIIQDAIDKARGRLLVERSKAFEDAQELGKKVTDERTVLADSQRRLAELEKQYAILQNVLRGIEAQIVFCENFEM